MKTTIDFLDAVKVRYDLPSDYAAAKVLGITRSGVSSYRNGKSFLDDSMAIRVAELLEIDARFVTACVHQERAKSEGEKALWASICALFPKSNDDVICIMLSLLAIIKKTPFA